MYIYLCFALLYSALFCFTLLYFETKINPKTKTKNRNKNKQKDVYIYIYRYKSTALRKEKKRKETGKVRVRKPGHARSITNGCVRACGCVSELWNSKFLKLVLIYIYIYCQQSMERVRRIEG